MKTLIWKEWRETRSIPAAFCVLFAVANLFVITVQYYVDHSKEARGTPPGGIYTVEIVLMGAAVCAVLATIVCGANIVSHEGDKGTLLFLTSLPLSRRSLWFTKAWIGWAASSVAVLGIAVLTLAFLALCFGKSGIPALYHNMTSAGQFPVVLLLALCSAVLLMVIYAISYAASCLTNQPLAAVALALICCGAVAALTFSLASVSGVIVAQKINEYRQHLISWREFNFYLPVLMFASVTNWWPGIILATTTLLAIALQVSYAGFAAERGMSGGKRFQPALRILGKWTAAYATMGAAYYLIGLYGAFHTPQPSLQGSPQPVNYEKTSQ